MNQDAGKLAIEKLISTYGCLPSAADGPRLEGFSPDTLAAALNQEILRAQVYGWSKITLHMDIPDAAQLMTFLRT